MGRGLEESEVGKLLTLNEWDEGVDLIIVLDSEYTFIIDSTTDRIGLQGMIPMRCLKDDD